MNGCVEKHSSSSFCFLFFFVFGVVEMEGEP
jgi:hypothetical protein